MRLEVVSPEATLFSGEVNSVSVPGINGSFQLLENHAPIVSVLVPGKVKLVEKLLFQMKQLITLVSMEKTHFWNCLTAEQLK